MQRSRAPRRSQAEVKKAILAAAATLFGQRGYANTTTRAIADEAKSSEALLFKYFGSKSNIFEATMSAHFDRIIDDGKSVIHQLPGFGRELSAPERMEYIVDVLKTFYKLMRSDNKLMLALITARAYEASPDDGVRNPEGLRRFLDGEDLIGRAWAEAGLESPMPAWLVAKFAVSSVIAAAVLGDWLFDDVVSDAEIADSLARFVTGGIYGVAGAAPSKTRYRPRRERVRAARRAEGRTRR